jgi:hypothetical protein
MTLLKADGRAYRGIELLDNEQLIKRVRADYSIPNKNGRISSFFEPEWYFTNNGTYSPNNILIEPVEFAEKDIVTVNTGYLSELDRAIKNALVTREGFSRIVANMRKKLTARAGILELKVRSHEAAAQDDTFFVELKARVRMCRITNRGTPAADEKHTQVT